MDLSSESAPPHDASEWDRRVDSASPSEDLVVETRDRDLSGLREDRAVSTDAPRLPRWVVLGASNVRLGLAPLTATLRDACGGPFEGHFVAGHGRSYGMSSWAPFRTLPGILDADLWNDLGDDALDGAVVTDVGNDLFYGVAPEKLVRWVDEAVRRLRARTDRIVLTGLPLMNGQGPFAERKFAFLRRVFFPGLSLSLADVNARGAETHAGVAEVAGKHGATLKLAQPEWYGFDPIHFRRALRDRIWRSLLDVDRHEAMTTRRESLRLMFSSPKRRVTWGVVRHSPQPAARLADGATISLY